MGETILSNMQKFECKFQHLTNKSQTMSLNRKTIWVEKTKLASKIEHLSNKHNKMCLTKKGNLVEKNTLVTCKIHTIKNKYKTKMFD